MSMKIKKKIQIKPSKSKNRKPFRAADVPVTAKMLYGVRDELIERMDSQFHSLKSEIHEFRSEIHEMKSEIHGMKSEIHGIKAEIHGIKSEIHEIKSEVNGLKAEIHGLKADIHEIKADVHRIALLVEEQNARNVFVLDGLTGLFDRQDRLEKEMSRRS